MGWQPIETAPKDGRVVYLTWMENGEPQEVWPMLWGHIQRNGLFPGKVGMWVLPGGGATWNDDGEGGPTHWKPTEWQSDSRPTDGAPANPDKGQAVP